MKQTITVDTSSTSVDGRLPSPEGKGRQQTVSGNKVQFVEGKVIFVWKKTGVRNGKDGIMTSERTGQDYPDIEPTEPLMVLQKFGSTRARCKRGPARLGQPDQEVVVHINHVNSKSSYYAARSNKEELGALTPEQKIAKAKAELAAAERVIKEAEAQLPTPAVSDSDRALAESLFNDDATPIAELIEPEDIKDAS